MPLMSIYNPQDRSYSQRPRCVNTEYVVNSLPKPCPIYIFHLIFGTSIKSKNYWYQKLSGHDIILIWGFQMVVSSTINGELTQQDRELNMIEPQNLVGGFSIPPGMTMQCHILGFFWWNLGSWIFRQSKQWPFFWILINCTMFVFLFHHVAWEIKVLINGFQPGISYDLYTVIITQRNGLSHHSNPFNKDIHSEMRARDIQWGIMMGINWRKINQDT